MLQESDTDNLGVSSEDMDDLERKAKGLDRKKDEVDNSLKPIKICATRHGCTGATNCDYSYGAPVGR